MTYRVVHRTEYLYDLEVSSSYGELYVLPRDVPGQVCPSSKVLIEPEPHDFRERADFYGNRVASFTVLEPHIRLTVTAESIVDVTRAAAVPLRQSTRPGKWCASASASTRPSMPWASTISCSTPPRSTVSPAVAAYAAESFPTGRSLTEALTELTSRIHATSRTSPGRRRFAPHSVDLLERRKGVCQDFAHLAVGCLRSLGLRCHDM